jgi:AcrR family transcriptional regulator
LAKPTQRRTQAARREEAETRLLKFATKLVAERGYDGFTLADVAEAAGYSRGLPAHYFGRKEDLLSRVAQNVVDSYNRSLANLAAIDRGLPHIEEMIRGYVRARGIEIRALGILVSQALVVPKLRQTINQLNDLGLRSIEAEIKTGIGLGNIRPDINISGTAALIYAFMRGQISFSLIDPGFDQISVGDEFIAVVRERLQPRA